jgi:hypothetical protein
MLNVLARGCQPAPVPPGAFSPNLHPGTCYEWASVLAQSPWWTPWRMAVIAATVTIMALALAAHFRDWFRLSRILLAITAAWGFTVTGISLPWVHLLHISTAGVVICGLLAVACIVVLRMTREARP